MSWMCQQDTRVPVQLITLKAGDLNGDGQINSGDLLILQFLNGNENGKHQPQEAQKCDNE